MATQGTTLEVGKTYKWWGETVTLVSADPDPAGALVARTAKGYYVVPPRTALQPLPLPFLTEDLVIEERDDWDRKYWSSYDGGRHANLGRKITIHTDGTWSGEG